MCENSLLISLFFASPCVSYNVSAWHVEPCPLDASVYLLNLHWLVHQKMDHFQNLRANYVLRKLLTIKIRLHLIFISRTLKRLEPRIHLDSCCNENVSPILSLTIIFNLTASGISSIQWKIIVWPKNSFLFIISALIIPKHCLTHITFSRQYDILCSYVWLFSSKQSEEQFDKRLSKNVTNYMLNLERFEIRKFFIS